MTIECTRRCAGAVAGRLGERGRAAGVGRLDINVAQGIEAVALRSKLALPAPGYRTTSADGRRACRCGGGESRPGEPWRPPSPRALDPVRIRTSSPRPRGRPRTRLVEALAPCGRRGHRAHRGVRVDWPDAPHRVLRSCLEAAEALDDSVVAVRARAAGKFQWSGGPRHPLDERNAAWSRQWPFTPARGWGGAAGTACCRDHGRAFGDGRHSSHVSAVAAPAA